MESKVYEEWMALAKRRCSIRQFDSRPVEPEIITAILEAGRLAPSACNYQPQRVLVINSPDAIQKLRKCTVAHFDAPAALLVCCHSEECYHRSYDGKASGEIDATIAATHMMLAAAALGIGATWVMHFIPEAIREEFAVPEQLEPVALLVMGYPAADAVPSPAHFQRKQLEELVFYNRF